jgi:hypothetical protein
MAKILKIHPEDFERVLIEDVGFREVEKVGVAGEGGMRWMHLNDCALEY